MKGDPRRSRNPLDSFLSSGRCYDEGDEICDYGRTSYMRLRPEHCQNMMSNGRVESY